MARTYVPGYGYVESDGPGTRGTVRPGPKPKWSGQEPAGTPVPFPRPIITPPNPEDELLTGDMPRLELNVDLSPGGLLSPDEQQPGANAQAQTESQSVLAAELGQTTFTSEGQAQRVADINDGYVVEESPGVFKVVYGIWALNAANRDAIERRKTPSNYENLPTDPMAGTPSNYRNLPGGSDPTNPESQYIGSTFSTDPLRYAPQYRITQSIASESAAPLMTYQEYYDGRQKGNPQSFLVYMGEVTTAGSTGATSAPNFQDARFVSNYMNLEPTERQRVYDMVNRYYNYWEPSYIAGLWEKAVNAASEQLLLTGRQVSPFGIFEEAIAAEAAMNAESKSNGYSGGGGGGFGGGGGTATIRLTSRTDALVILNQAMQQFLGRKASPQELEKFVKALNSQERANPITQEFQGDTVIQAGGFNPQTFAEEFALAKDGSAEYQAATSFLDAFMSVLDGDSGVL